MAPNPLGALVGLLLAGTVFWALQSRFATAGTPRYPWRRPGARTDLAYWFFNPLVTKTLTRVTVVGCVALLAIITGVELREGMGIEPLLAGSLTLAQPLWLQALESLLLLDFLGYWIHRAFHRGRLWRAHAIHHSPVHLDWLAAVRVHPINDALGAVLRVIPLLLLGFDPRVLAAAVPVFGAYGLLLHANIPWSFGPLRYVFASPVFHRWHHARTVRGDGVNFAGLLPVFDIVFGTFHMPADQAPEQFGVDDPVPDGLIGQIAYPFRRSPATRRKTPV